MTSDDRYEEAYVWIWLPEETEPVVAGRVEKDGNRLIFNYPESLPGRCHRRGAEKSCIS